MEQKEEFYGNLKQKFIALLRAEGFVGSRNDFRKVSNEVIHAINIQNNRNGTSCCINLGIHLSFLPNTTIKKLKEVDCEFRVRLAPKGVSDFWWPFSSSAQSVEHICSVYCSEGAEFFRKFSTIESIEAELSSRNYQSGEFSSALGVTLVRAALSLAYIYQHQGNTKMQFHFANIGLENIGRATSLKKEFESLIKNT